GGWLQKRVTLIMPLDIRQWACVRYFFLLLLVIGGVGGFALRAEAAKMTTAFAVIEYSEHADLQTFGENVGRGRRGGVVVQEISGPLAIETSLRLSHLVGHIQMILGMQQIDLRFRIKILASPRQVQRVYREMYGADTDYIAFYAPRSKTIFLAASTLRPEVIVHEIAHVIVDRYFGKAPSVKVHELLAQYVETQM
ncbi:MAG: hypothetical protein L3J63_06355, partial [Geopsychrobacter sp.]|nr:hypothetical protein [Geopsychrobacter sp.]